MTVENLGPIVRGSSIGKELRRRKQTLQYKTLTAASRDLLRRKLEIEQDEGWEVARRNKNSIRLGKPKPADELLEDRVWSFLAQMGFVEMSKGRQFKIRTSDTATIPPRQIDVFAKDDEAALVVECTQKETVGRKSMEGLINKFQSQRRAIVKSIQSHYSSVASMKVGFLIATKNIVWSAADLQKCHENGIFVIAETEIQYYEDLVRLLKSAARYQLLAHVFAGSRVSGLERSVLATRAKMGGTTFYTFLIRPDQLLRIAYIGHKSSRDLDGVQTYQRMLQPRRLRSIAQYINNGGKFPTNIVLNLKPAKKIRFDKKETVGEESLGILYLPDTYASAWVIDGQHRLYGYAHARETSAFKYDHTSVPVLAFDNLPSKREQELFIDINSKQVKVPTALLVELYSDLHWGSGSPEEAHQALLSRLVTRLNAESGSPLCDRVRVIGKRKSFQRCLTTTSLRDGLDHARLLGTVSSGMQSPGPLSTGDMTDYVGNLGKAKEVIWRILDLVAEANQPHWVLGDQQGGYLATNNGIRALFLVIADIARHIEVNEGWTLHDATAEEVVEALQPYINCLTDYVAQAPPGDLTAIRKVGSSLTAVRQQSYRLEAQIRERKAEFNPAGLQQYLESLDEEGTRIAGNRIREIHRVLYEHIVETLKEHFGPTDREWWVQAVPIKIRKECSDQWEENGRQGEAHEELYLIHYQNICLYQGNWTIFKDVVSLGEKDRDNKQKNTKWIKEINDLRQITAHPERGPLNRSQVERVEEIYEKVMAYFPNAAKT